MAASRTRYTESVLKFKLVDESQKQKRDRLIPDNLP